MDQEIKVQMHRWAAERQHPTPGIRDNIRLMARRAIIENEGNLEAATNAFISHLSRDELLEIFSTWIKPATGDYLRPAAKAVAASKRDGGQPIDAEKANTKLHSSRPSSKPVQVQEHRRNEPFGPGNPRIEVYLSLLQKQERKRVKVKKKGFR